jgi:adenylyltransferase/sulfurtransferase
MSNWKDVEFSGKELGHYSRHLSIPEFGMEGQKKLKNAKVLAVGTGGLGAPMLQYLAAAGVGTIGIVDFDTVEASNLHRQILFGAADVGRPKVEVAKERLLANNPYIDINVHNVRLTSENALEIIKEYDVVADGTDNFPTRYLINDACVMLDKPNVHGSIFQFEGQISVFNYQDEEGKRGPNYRDLFPEPPPPGLVPSCAEAGVLGVLPGIIGSLQASEVIKIITGIGDPLAGQLFLFDAQNFSTRKVTITKNEDNPLTGDNPSITELIDYEAFCGIPTNGEAEEEDEASEVPEVSVTEYQSWLEAGEDIQLIDVREPYEAEIADIGGDLIPLKTVLEHADDISRNQKVVVHCRSGARSADAIKQLQDSYDFDNLYNLKGGILAWSEQIDDSIPQY